MPHGDLLVGKMAPRRRTWHPGAGHASSAFFCSSASLWQSVLGGGFVATETLAVDDKLDAPLSFVVVVGGGEDEQALSMVNSMVKDALRKQRDIRMIAGR